MKSSPYLDESSKEAGKKDLNHSVVILPGDNLPDFNFLFDVKNSLAQGTERFGGQIFPDVV